MSDQKKAQRRQIDPVFKQVLTDEMLPFTATMQTEVEVSRLPRTIDALITINAESERQRITAETPFFYFLKTNQIEFKAGNTTYLRYAYEIRPQVTREVLTMAGISATLSREDLEFMANDIGPELVPFLKPEDVYKGMDPEKQQKLIAFMAGDIDSELVKGVEPEKQMRLFSTTLEALVKGIGLENRKLVCPFCGHCLRMLPTRCMFLLRSLS